VRKVSISTAQGNMQYDILPDQDEIKSEFDRVTAVLSKMRPSKYLKLKRIN